MNHYQKLNEFAKRTMRDGDKEWSRHGGGGSHERLVIDADTTISFTYPDDEMRCLAPGGIFVSRRVHRFGAPRPYVVYRIEFDAEAAARISRLANGRRMCRSILNFCAREAGGDHWTYAEIVAENSCEIVRVDVMLTILNPVAPDTLEHMSDGIYEATWYLFEESDARNFMGLLQHPHVVVLGKPFSPVPSIVAVRFGFKRTVP